MRKIFRLLILLVLLIPNKAMALACDNSQKVKYQEMAKNIATTYSYDDASGKFNITFSNIPENFVIWDSTDISNITYYNYSSSEITIGNFLPGKSYRFYYYVNDVMCGDERLFSTYINLPFYNPYYNDPICKDLDYKYCNKWYRMNLSYEEFIKDVTDYRNSLNIPIVPREEVKGLFDKIIEFYMKYYFIILPLIILISISSIIYYNKKNDLF